MRDRLERRHPEILKKINVLLEKNPAIFNDKSILNFLPAEIFVVLSEFDNQEPTGKINPVYFLLQFAVHKVTDFSFEIAETLRRRKELDRQIEEQELKRLIYHGQRNSRLIEKAKEIKKSASIDTNKKLREQLHQDRRDDLSKRRELLEKNKQGQPYQPVNEASQLRNSEGTAWTIFKILTGGAIQDPSVAAKANYFTFLQDEIVGKNKLNRAIKDMATKASEVVETIKSDINTKIVENGRLQSKIRECEEILGRIKSIENLELTGKSVEAKPVQQRTIKIKVEGNEKAFDWSTGKTVAENVRELVGAYLQNQDYHHTRVRKLSAKRVLDKIRELSEGQNAISDPIERDKALVNFLRREKNSFSVFGFNRKESQLHAIYRQAEVQLKDRVEQSFGTDIVKAIEIAKGNNELIKQLAKLKEINRKSSEPINRPEQMQQLADRASANLGAKEKGGSEDSKDFESEYQQILGELHKQNAKQFKMSSEELLLMTSSEDQLVCLDKQKVELRRDLLEKQKE
ncbi:MAG: hypothetical protein SFU25_05620, partial [Candidatus Caenarcaniphilales bacterium]|nr:hypothetical protein [Candidatus Caenarcaniphilales bacterium]